MYYPRWDWVLPKPIDVTKKQTGTPLSADVLQSSISVSARILTPNYLLIVIFNNLTDFNVKWPNSLPGTKSLAKGYGSPCYFEITPQIQSKAGVTFFLVFMYYVSKMQSPFLPVCKEDKNEDKITLLSCLHYKNHSSSLSWPDVQSSSAVHFQGGGGKKLYSFLWLQISSLYWNSETCNGCHFE